MAEPSIVVDLLLRDLTAATVDAVATRIKTQLESLSINIPVVTPQAIQPAVKAVSNLKTQVQDLTAATEKHKRATVDDVIAGKVSTEQFIRDTAARKAAMLQLEHQVNRATLPLLSPAIRDAMGKRFGRSALTIEHPFASLISKEGLIARFSSLFAGQVGTLIVYGTVIRGVTKGIEEFIRSNVELEDALAKVSTILEGSGEKLDGQYKRLREQAIAWGRTHAQSAKEAADAMYFLLSAGQSVEEVQKNLPAVLNLAYGGYLDTAFAAETVATAYELFRKEGESVVDIVNKIQKTNEVSQVTVEQYASAFTYLASTADQAKISFDEVSAAIGTLGTLGLRGSKGGRNLDEAIGQLLKKQGDLRELGIEIADVNGDLKSFSEILEAFRVRLGSKVDIAELKILRDIFGQQGGRAMGLMIENSQLYLDKLNKIKSSEGEIYDAALKRAGTLSQAWEMFKNKLAATAQEMGGVSDALQFLLTLENIGGRRNLVLVELLGGEQGAAAVRYGIREIGKLTASELRDMMVKLRKEFRGEGPWKDIIRGDSSDLVNALRDPALLATAKEQTIEFFKRLAEVLEASEETQRQTEIVAGLLHIQTENLAPLTFTARDAASVKQNAREYFLKLLAALSSEIDALVRHGGGQVGPSAELGDLSTRLSIVDQILKGVLDDRQLRDVNAKVRTFFAELNIAISRAQLDMLRSSKKVDFGKQLEIIDLELVVNLRKNQEEYAKQIASIPEEIKNNAKEAAKAKAGFQRELNFKDIADKNRAAAATIRLQIDQQFGEGVIERLRRDLASIRIGLAKSIPDEWLSMKDRLQLVDDEMLAELDKNVATYLSEVLTLPDKILADAAQFAEAKKVLQEGLRLEDVSVRNRAFYEKDKQIRQEAVRQFEAQLQQQARLQELYLAQADAGDGERRIRRNELLKKELLERTKFLAPTIRLQFDETGALTTDTEAFFRQLDLVGKMREEISKLDVADISVEALEKLKGIIREIGIEAGLSGDKLDEFIDRLLGVDPKITTTTELVHGFADAFGALSGAMQVIGNKDTWSAVAQGISTIEATYSKVRGSLDLIGEGKTTLGALGLISAGANVVSFLASLLSRQEPNPIGVEEYRYEAGRNVSAGYGRAQTINVRVDLNPNFNLLDPSQLTEVVQRRIAQTLADDIEVVFEDMGRFERR